MRTFLMAFLCALPAAADEWEPPAKLKITWPSQFSIKELPVSRVQEASNFICVRGKKGSLDYVYAAKATPNGLDIDRAASQAKKGGKFELLSSDSGEAVLKRGGTIAWISFSHRALPCRAVIKGKKPASEMFFELDIPKTTLVSDDDWMKFCEEASEVFDQGRR